MCTGKDLPGMLQDLRVLDKEWAVYLSDNTRLFFFKKRQFAFLFFNYFELGCFLPKGKSRQIIIFIGLKHS